MASPVHLLSTCSHGMLAVAVHSDRFAFEEHVGLQSTTPHVLQILRKQRVLFVTPPHDIVSVASH